MNADTILAPLRQIWAGQTPREQVMIVACGALMALIALWFLVLAPALDYRGQARASFEAQLEDHLALVTGIERHRALAASGEQSAGQGAPLRTLIGTRAREDEVPITRVQPMENGQLSVWVDRISEERLMAFLLGLAEEEGVRVTRMSLDRESADLVRVQMVLTRTGGGA